MPNSGFSIVLTHREAVGFERGRERVASVIPQLAVLLVARGANRIVIPAPNAIERERIDVGLDGLPSDRSRLIKIADKDGDLLSEVRDYLNPLARQAKKWPEDAFVYFATDFLYGMSLGLTHGAGVLARSASIMREFVPIVDPYQFSGEARFRLAELFRLICAYEPEIVEQGLFQTDRPHAVTSSALSIMADAKFNELVVASGTIGYLKHPLVGLKKLKRHFLALIERPVVKGTMTIASTAVDAAGGGGVASAVVKSIGFAVPNSKEPFRPAFISLGPAELSLYWAVLREQMPGATPPPDQIMAFKTRSNYSWLGANEGEKLAREAAEGNAARKTKHAKAVAALNNLISGSEFKEKFASRCPNTVSNRSLRSNDAEQIVEPESDQDKGRRMKDEWD